MVFKKPYARRLGRLNIHGNVSHVKLRVTLGFSRGDFNSNNVHKARAEAPIARVDPLRGRNEFRVLNTSRAKLLAKNIDAVCHK